MWLAIVLVLVLIAVVALSIFLIVFASAETPKPLVAAPAPAVAPAPAPPAPEPYPCLMKDSFGKTIYGAFMDAGKLGAGAPLLEVLELFMCTFQNCSKELFAANKNKLMSLGATADDAAAQARARSFADFTSPTPASAFLTMTTFLITKHLAQLKEAKAMPLDEIQQLNGYVYQMCAHTYPSFLRTCKDVGLP